MSDQINKSFKERAANSTNHIADHLVAVFSIVIIFADFIIDKGVVGQPGVDRLSWGFALCIFLLVIYQGVQLFLIRHLTKERERLDIKMDDLIKRSEAAEIIIKKSHEASEILSSEMVKIVRHRGRLDDAMFSAPYNGEAISKVAIDNALRDYLNSLCQSATSAISVMKHAPPEKFQANIKMLFDNGSGTYMHRTLGRHGLSSRAEHDLIHGSFPLDGNKCMKDALIRAGSKYCLIDDIEIYLDEMHKVYGVKAYHYPHDDCKKYYKSMLMIPIYGPRYERSIDRGIPNIDTNYVLSNGNEPIGFISLDSFDYQFDAVSDTQILREIAAEVYSGLRAAEFFKTASFNA